MARRDHCVTLGVPRTETTARMRSAFRDLAKKHHPDRIGTKDSETFRDVVGAYPVLSDPALRSCHDGQPRRREVGPDLSRP